MNRYTIYCTPEQTMKALELGAPIQFASINDIRLGRYIEVESNNEAYGIPTAEQMIGWIEENKYMTIEVVRTCVGYRYFAYFVVGREIGGRYDTRSEATIAAIDAALEYLSNNKK